MVNNIFSRYKLLSVLTSEQQSNQVGKSMFEIKIPSWIYILFVLFTDFKISSINCSLTVKVSE